MRTASTCPVSRDEIVGFVYSFGIASVRGQRKWSQGFVYAIFSKNIFRRRSYLFAAGPISLSDRSPRTEGIPKMPKLLILTSAICFFGLLAAAGRAQTPTPATDGAVTVATEEIG